MKHALALIIKFVMVTIVLEVVLKLMTNLTFGDIVYVSAAVTIIAYIVGDLAILRVSNNFVATLSDIGLAFLIILMFNYSWYNVRISVIDALVAAVVVGIGEIFFHKYVENYVFVKTNKAE
ncbi:hypothetical protein NL50_09490 [Clostridium acetobutylicum]|nr:hypothetical protein NL50_09490 [Clostridium acetobutylicum]